MNHKEHTLHHHHLPLITWVCIGLLVFLISLGGGIMAATLLSPPKKAPMTLKTITKSTTAAQLVDAYKGSIGDSLKKSGYAQQTKGFLNPSISYSGAGVSYIVHVSPPATILYERNDTNQKTNDVTQLNNLDSFMQQEGFNKTTVTTIAGASTVTYDNSPSGVMCQSLQRSSTAQHGASLSLSCATHDTLKTEQTAVASLVALYSQNHTVPSLIDVTRVYAEEGTKHLDALIINARSASPASFSLYFAGLTSDSTTYIGSQAAVNIDNPQVPAPSSDLVNAVHDSRYGDFLTKNIVLNGTTKL